MSGAKLINSFDWLNMNRLSRDKSLSHFQYILKSYLIKMRHQCKFSSSEVILLQKIHFLARNFFNRKKTLSHWMNYLCWGRLPTLICLISLSVDRLDSRFNRRKYARLPFLSNWRGIWVKSRFWQVFSCWKHWRFLESWSNNILFVFCQIDELLLARNQSFSTFPIWFWDISD